MLGIESYNPKFYTETGDIVAELNEAFQTLIGKVISEVWVVYDINENKWFKDCPVILIIDGMQVEISAYKIDELAITFNSISMSEKLNWYDMDDFKLEWRKNAFSDILAVLNKKICNIEIMEYNLVTEITYSKDNPKEQDKKISAWLLNGIGFELDDGYFAVFNGLDENNISIKQDLSENIRTFKVLRHTAGPG